MTRPKRRLPFRLQLTAAFTSLVVGVEAIVFAGVAFILTASRGFSTEIEPMQSGGLYIVQPTRSLVATILWGTGAGLVLLAAGGAIAAWYLTGRLLRPFSQIIATARLIDDDNLDARIDVDGPFDEIREVSSTLNSMLDRVADTARRRAMFAANASHELRTPLAAMKTTLQVGLRDPLVDRAVLVSVHDKVEEMIGITGSLLRLASPDHEADDSDLDVVSVDAIVSDTLKKTEAERASYNISTTLHLDGGTHLGWPDLVERFMAVALQNAVVHNRPDGRIEVRTQSTSTSFTVLILNTRHETTDLDPGVLVEPFQRGRRTRAVPGHGLGLSIAAAIATTLRADLRISPTPDSFEVRLTVPAIESRLQRLP